MRILSGIVLSAMVMIAVVMASKALPETLGWWLIHLSAGYMGWNMPKWIEGK